MAARKPKTAEKPAETVSEEKVVQETPETVEAPETVSEKKLVNLINTTKYAKVSPRNGAVFPPSSVVKDVVYDSWVEVQVKAGILKEVE